MNEIEKLKECCRLRGLQQDLIHRTIREFNWFISAIVFGALSNNKEEQEIFEKYKDFHYEGENTLEAWINLFYEYCKEEYK